MIFLKCAALAFLIPLWIVMAIAACNAASVCIRKNGDDEADGAAILAVIIMVLAGSVAGCIIQKML